MAFEIKDFASIAASLINIARATLATGSNTDFNVGSVIRTLLEAPAAEMDILYQSMLQAVLDGIEVGTYNSFSFAALPAQAAAGLVSVTIAAQATDTVIGAGTLLTRTDGSVSYTVLADATIPAAGTTATLVVVCTVPGVAGNQPGGTALTMTPQPVGFSGATTLNDFINGTDAETPDQRRTRFAAFVQSLARSPVAGLEYGVKTATIEDSAGNPIERVALAYVDEPFERDDSNPTGVVDIYIHNGIGSTTTPLLDRAQAIIDGYAQTDGTKVPGYKAAGVVVTVHKASEVTRAVTGVITAAPGYDKPTLVELATAALSDYLLGLNVGATCLFAKLEQLVMDIPGVVNFVISSPSPGVDTTVTFSQKIMPGTLAITAA